MSVHPLKKLVGQTAVYGIPTIVGRLLNYFLVPLYTYTFSTSEYGVVTEMYAYVAFLLVLVTYGMETAFFRFSKKYEGNTQVYSTAMWSMIVSSTLFALLVSLFSQPIANAIGYPNHREYFIWFGLILSIDAVTAVPFAYLRNQNKAGRFSFIKMMNISVNILFNLFFILFCPYWMKNHPDSILGNIYHQHVGVGYIFISNLLASVITFLLLIPEIKNIHRIFNTTLWKEMLAYAFPIMIWGMAGIVNETFDRVLLKYLISDPAIAMSQLGIYGACYKVSIIMTLFIQAFKFAAEPFFFHHASDKNAPSIYAQVMRFFVIVCAFIFLFGVVFLDDLMKFVGPAFRVGAPVVPILLMANLFLGIFYNLSVWYKITDKTMYGAYISIAGAVLTLILNIVLVPIMGYMGAAWATLVCYLFIAVISYISGQKYYPIPYPVKRILFYLLLVVLMYVIKIHLPIHTALAGRLVGMGFVSLYLLIVYMLEFRKKGLKIQQN